MPRPPKIGTRSWLEYYDEMHDIGIPEWEIAKKLGYSAATLVRMLQRKHRPVDPLLQDIADDEDRAKRKEAS
jgi:hypothetical protein